MILRKKRKEILMIFNHFFLFNLNLNNTSLEVSSRFVIIEISVDKTGVICYFTHDTIESLFLLQTSHFEARRMVVNENSMRIIEHVYTKDISVYRRNAI